MFQDQIFYQDAMERNLDLIEIIHDSPAAGAIANLMQSKKVVTVMLTLIMLTLTLTLTLNPS